MGTGSRKRARTRAPLLRRASRSSERPSRTLRAADAMAYGHPWPPFAATRRGRQVGTKGWSLRSNIGMESKAEPTDIPHLFMSIDYRESVIVLRQVLCHFSLPTILSAHNSVGRSVIPFCFCRSQFLCARSMMRTDHETSHIVISFPVSPHQIPWSGSVQLRLDDRQRHGPPLVVWPPAAC